MSALKSSGSQLGGQWMNRCASAFKGWTGRAHARVVYDSDVDEFTATGLFEGVRDKENIAVVAFTTDGDVFGGFYRVAVTEQKRDFCDPTIFAFSFESHGRCATPQRFAPVVDPNQTAFVRFHQRDVDGWFFSFGVGGLGFVSCGNERSETWCDGGGMFEGLGETTLTGKTWTDGCRNVHRCVRLISVALF